MIDEYKKYVIETLSDNAEIKLLLENTTDMSIIEHILTEYRDVMSYQSFIKQKKIDSLFNL